MAQSSLQNILSYSFPAQNLIEFSLVKDTSPDLPVYKTRFFFFISLIPASKDQSGNRTFNRDEKVTLKVSTAKFQAFIHALKLQSNNRTDDCADFSIFVDSSKSGYSTGGGFKMCFTRAFQMTSKSANKEFTYIAISIKTGQAKPVGNYYTKPEALAIADMLEFMFHKCIELDYLEKNQVNTGRISPNNQQPNNQQPNNQQPNNQQPNDFFNNQQPNNQQNISKNFTQGINDVFGDDIPF